jgi:hypothetical protein
MKAAPLNILIPALLLYMASQGALEAQSYSINWHKVAGGGGTSASVQYSVSGTIGQQDASGPLTGGGYSLTGGFWTIISVVQTVNSPVLTIVRLGSNVVVSWPSLPTGYTLQQNTNLAATNSWAPSAYSITTANGTNNITITAPSGNLFFRLANL